MNTLKILMLLLMISFPAMAGGTASGAGMQDDRAMQAADTRIILNIFTGLAEEQGLDAKRDLQNSE